MKSKLLFTFLAVVLATAVADAQPPGCIDLGSITSISSDYTIPDLSVVDDPFMSEIHWYCFSIPQATGATGPYLDIDLFATGTTGQADTEIGVYDSVGNLVANDDDDGHSLRSALSFGNTTPRTMPPDPFGFTNGVDANGRDGNLAAGSTYYLAVSLFSTTHGATGWNVTSTSTADPAAVTVNFRTDVVPEPGCGLLLAGLVGGFISARRRLLRP